MSVGDGTLAPDGGAARPALRLRRSPVGPPLYWQVCERIEKMALAAPLADEAPLPPEAQLMARFGVSRGTLRRATEELARQGLLRIEPGRGTFVVQATRVRRAVWNELAKVARPDSRFDVDLDRFVPDFAGRERCDERLAGLDAYVAARTVLAAPDNSLEAFRAAALADGKRLVVPTYGMRRGFVLLDGRHVRPEDRSLAATLDGMERFGRPLNLAGLRSLRSVDLVASGAVAVTRSGIHLGSGDGFLDLEWGLLCHLGLAGPDTPVVASVHSCQVIDAPIRPGRHDVIVDLIVTPGRLLRCPPTFPKPAGLFFDELRVDPDRAGPYVRELLADRLVASVAALPGGALPGGGQPGGASTTTTTQAG